MVPGEQRVTPNFGPLQATVPVGGQGMEIRPWKPPVANRGLLCFFKHRIDRACSKGVGASPSSIHRVCVTTRLRTTRGYMPSRRSLRRLAERIRKVDSALVPARGKEPFFCYGDGLGTATIFGGNRDTRRVLISARR